MNYDILTKAAIVLSYQTLMTGLRYLMIVAPAYFIFWKWGKDKFANYKIQKGDPPDLSAEFFWSAVTVVIFAVSIILAGELYALGATKIYLNVEERGWPYFFFSIYLMLLMQDTYFYWTHRFMHLPGVFRVIHRVHHLAKSPTPWSSYSFHPVEAVIHAVILPLIVTTLPVHPAALGFFLLLDLMVNVLGHLGYEFFPARLMRGLGGVIYNTSTHHNMHHQFVNSNFGLYFNVWDRLFGTNHPQYAATYEEVVSRRGNTGSFT